MTAEEEQIYLKFPSVLKSFLSAHSISFSEQTLFTYSPFQAYRGVIREATDKTPINKGDFLSYAELGKKPRGVNVNDIGYYSCSLFLNTQQLAEALKLPRPNKKIITGIVKCENGPQETNVRTQHVHWWLYDKNNAWEDFHFCGDEI